MEMKKKLAIIILAMILTVSGVSNILLGIIKGAGETREEKNVLRAGEVAPYVLDPVDKWDYP